MCTVSYKALLSEEKKFNELCFHHTARENFVFVSLNRYLMTLLSIEFLIRLEIGGTIIIAQLSSRFSHRVTMSVCIYNVCQSVCLCHYVHFLGLSLALRSHDQFQASHCLSLPPQKKKNSLCYRNKFISNNTFW